MQYLKIKSRWLWLVMLLSLAQVACGLPEPTGNTTPTPAAPCDACGKDEYCLKDVCVACKPGTSRACDSKESGPCREGVQLCTAKGEWAASCLSKTKPKPETCNGIDDDCDGTLDEGDTICPSGAECRIGKCKVITKLVTCAEDTDCNRGEYCKKEEKACYRLPTCKDSESICGRVCTNRKTDNKNCGKCGYVCRGRQFCYNGGCVTCSPGETRPCGSDKGACQKGTQTCDARGDWGKCEGGTSPIPETCNGLDDDCDGEVDENPAKVGQRCEGANTRQKGRCAAGVYACERGTLFCRQNKPIAESCNGIDDDCDGSIDNATRGGAAVCAGSCKFPYDIPVPKTNPHSYNYTNYLVLDPDTGNICAPKNPSRALYFNVSWDRYHGYRQVRFSAQSGWAIRGISSPKPGSKGFPYGHYDVRVVLKSPTGKYFAVRFDWSSYANIKVHSIEVVSAR